MTQPHQIDREAVIEGLRNEARKLRSQKERGPAFHAPWGQDIIDANNAKADLFTEAANMIEALSSRPAPEAVAWREKALADVIALRKDHPGQTERFYAEEAVAICRQALAVIPTEGLGSSLRDTQPGKSGSSSSNDGADAGFSWYVHERDGAYLVLTSSGGIAPEVIARCSNRNRAEQIAALRAKDEESQ